ncbi:hypothetical protein BB561_002278 [Smittium simulii]|uniref:Glutaredoxin-like protein n=1 Tax=Smittium simulii TaxID=133385 RepID=A0A2T9YQZ1_9FUNG|nr:hypothetical protein BB561_002277 [Smittium simulii]PVU94773.1 hypothetical protein BB561_002278 [Smittium simulii]
MSSNKVLLTLFTHADCQLCKLAKANLFKVQQKVPFLIEEVDIKLPENKYWFEEYKYDIPVVHANGKFLLWHQVNVEKTIQKLNNLKAQNTENTEL